MFFSLLLGESLIIKALGVSIIRRLLLQGITLASETLHSALRRVRNEVLEPYERIKEQTLQLENLQATTHLLRQTLQSIKLTARLRTHIKAGPSGADPPNASESSDHPLRPAKCKQ